jgi:hypothetical protein
MDFEIPFSSDRAPTEFRKGEAASVLARCDGALMDASTRWDWPWVLLKPDVGKDEKAVSSTDVNPQDQSPLFRLLPAELRSIMFHLMLTQYEDMSKAYTGREIWFRPGCRAPQRVDTSISSACRRAYHETRHIALRNAIITIYGFASGYSPLEAHALNYCFRSWGLIPRLTPTNMQDLTSLHFILRDNEVSELHGFFEACRPPNLRRVKITLAYTAWCGWSHGYHGHLYNGCFLRCFLDVHHRFGPAFHPNSVRSGLGFLPNSVLSVEIELETADPYLDQFRRCLESMKTQMSTIHGKDGAEYVLQPEPIYSTWSGPRKVLPHVPPPPGSTIRLLNPRPGEQVNIIEDNHELRPAWWNSEPRWPYWAPDQSLCCSLDDIVTYHVFTLRWSRHHSQTDFTLFVTPFRASRIAELTCHRNPVECGRTHT